MDIRVATPHRVSAPALTAYPWATDGTSGIDPYGLIKRQCTSFVAWYLNSHGTPFGYRTKGPQGVGIFGDATHWDTAARYAGFAVSNVPTVGAIAQWHANETSIWTVPGGWRGIQAGPLGHVAVVTAVNPDGSVDLAQYNLSSNRSFSEMSHVKAPRFIYIPLAFPAVP